MDRFRDEREIEKLKLMCVLAHPDDESLGMGGTLAKYASEGVCTCLVTATRGERGWIGSETDYPGPEALGRLRTAELAAAARILGLQQIIFLGYRDGELAQVEPTKVVEQLVAHLRKLRPDVVITFDPFGAYGHPDHIAISQLTTAAVITAADPNYGHIEAWSAHRVSKLYYRVVTRTEAIAYQVALGELAMEVNGVKRHLVTWPDWAVTAKIDTSAYWQQVCQAVACHRSQLLNYKTMQILPDDYYRRLWGSQTYYRIFSLVNGSDQVENDLFTGLRKSHSGSGDELI